MFKIDILSKVVIVELRGVIVVVVLDAHEVLALVEVDCVVLVSVRGTGVPQGRGLVVEIRIKVGVVLLSPGVKAGLLKYKQQMNI